MKSLVLVALLATPLEQPSPTPTEAPAPDAAQADREDGDLTPAVVEKLTTEQLMKVLHERSQPTDPSVSMGVPLAFFLLVLAIVALSLYAGVRKYQLRTEMLRALIEKGASLPPELLVPTAPGNADLRRGLVLVGAGLGLMAMLATVADHGVWTAGLLPLLMGAGYLFTWKLEPRSPRA
jgi:hypothetical protein